MILADLLANTHCLPSLKDKVAVIRRPLIGPHDLQMNLGRLTLPTHLQKSQVRVQ
jgi:hypothetical protein